jgi:hypothetical protein
MLTRVTEPLLIRLVEVTETLDVVERTMAYKPKPKGEGNLSRWKVTGGADFTAKPIQLSGMRKCSVYVREVAL